MATKGKRISFYEVYNEDNNESQYDMVSSASIVDIKRKLRIYDDIKSQDEFKSILNESIDDIIKDFNKSNTFTDSERLNKINETYLGLSNIYSKPLKNNMIDKFEDETTIDDLYVESQHNELIPLKINLPDKLAKTSKKEKRKSLIYNGQSYELLSDFCKPENNNNTNNSTFNDSSVLSDTSQIIDLTFDSEEHDYSINYEEMFNNPTYLGFNESNDCFVKKQTANMISDNFKKKHSFEKKQKKLPILPLEEDKIDEGDDEINEEVIDLDLIEARTDTESISSYFSSETFQGLLDLCDHNEKNLFLDLNADYQDIEEEIVQVPLRSPLRLSRDPQMHVAIAQSPILRNIDDISDENDDDSESHHDSSSFKFPSPLLKKQREACNSDESFEFPPLTINKIKRVDIAHNQNDDDDYYYLDKNIDKGDDFSVENISVFEENFNTNDLISSISFPILSNKRLYSEPNNGSGILSPSKLLNHEPLDYETSDSKSVVDLLEETCQFAQLVIDDL